MPLRIRHFESHARLSGDGFDHANAHHTHRARQILGEVHDRVALHADIGLNLVAGNDWTRVRGEHLHRHVELCEFSFDQARRELQRFARNDGLIFWQRLQERELWQR